MMRLLMIALLAMPAAAVASEGKKDERERRICKREAATGSLVQAKRTCLTKEEWKRTQWYNRQTHEEWQEAIDGKMRAG